MSQDKYYQEQLSKLDTKEQVSIKLLDFEGNQTNSMSLNLESINDLRVFLDDLESKILMKEFKKSTKVI